jgi:serine/threonine protein kinase
MKTHNESNNRLSNSVTDDKGYRHQLSVKLGQGGQGAVFRTMDRNVVIKALVDGMTGEIVKNEVRYEMFKSDINEVRILKLPDGIHIAKPIHILKKPNCGYIMRLLSDMVPIRKLIVSKDRDLKQFYLNTGGLRRRLHILAEAAKILTRIHSIPVVYADISPENVFISEDVSAKEVWFIDSDNMRHSVDFRKPIYTPGYGAPEIVKRTAGNNTLSDVYSFALLAFEVLALIAPFDGELILNGGGWDDEDKDYNAMAERGEVPWIEDEDDDSNFSDRGIPRRVVLSGNSNLRGLFQQTFSKAGRESPVSRPSMRKWYEVLTQAADATLTCKECGATFYIGNNNCPFCNGIRERVCLAQVFDRYLLEDDSGNQVEHYSKGVYKIFDITGKSEYQYLNSFHTGDSLLGSEIEDTFELSFERVVIVRNLTRTEMTIVHQGHLKLLPALGMYDCADLDEAVIQIPIHETRTRHISFRMI